MHIPKKLQVLILMRHADWTGPDHELTEKGIGGARLAAAAIRDHCQGSIALLEELFAPEVRRTVDLVKQATGGIVLIATWSAGPKRELDLTGSEFEEFSTIILVGHEPDLDQLLEAQLLWRDGSRLRGYPQGFGYANGVIINFATQRIKKIRP